MWTAFWDMHSGGGLKEKWSKIYIQAPEDEAKLIFYNRFGHSPERVSCTCCGEDYSIDSGEDICQLTGYHRSCFGATSTVKGDKSFLYVEQDEDGKHIVPFGFELDKKWGKPYGKYLSIKEYMESDDALFIFEEDIDPREREGVLPQQGYVWMD